MRDLKVFLYIGLAYLTVMGLGENEAECERNNFSEAELKEKTNLIIDTDAGSDDAVAILNLLGAEELFKDIKVHLITAVNGNTNAENVAKNVLKVLKTAKRLDIPVYIGANQSILVTPKVGNYFGKDGFGDFDFPNLPPSDLIEKKHAVNALIEKTTLYPGQLTLVCLGPLTNIALATRLDANFFKNLKEIYVLGGSDSAVGNVKPGVEFNFHMDPEAAFIVLKEAEKLNKIIHVVTWETASIRSVVEMNWRIHVLGALQSPQVHLLNKAENMTLTGKKWISSDTLLTSIIIDKSIVESSGTYHADVEVCGHISRGSLYVDYNNSTNLRKNVRIVNKISTEVFKTMLLQTLNSGGGEKNGA